MRKILKIIGGILRYVVGMLFIIMSFTSLNTGYTIHFIRALGFGVLLLPVIYKTINEEKIYKPKWEVLFPLFWFTIFTIIIYALDL